MEYSLDGFGSGQHMYGCGNECCAYTRASAQYVLVSDRHADDWLKADLGSVHSFSQLLNQGTVVMALSDELLFGYSSVTGDWDTVYYEGSLLKDNDQQLFRSYGCSDSIAFFVSDEKFYVFDSRMGNWQQYGYGCPENLSYGMFYPKEDCICFSLITNDYYGKIRNIVYSAHTASFNSISNGCNISQPAYDHGYCGIRDKTGFGDEFQIVGYSAFDNAFDTISYSTEDDEHAIIYCDAGMEADQITAYTLGFREMVTPSVLVKVKFYGYSTLLGEWNTAAYDVDWTAERYYGSGYAGGRYTMDHALEQNSEKWIFYFYSAEDGTFSKVHTDLVYSSTTSGFTLGGKVFGVHDADHVWGYDPTTGNGSLADLSHENSSFLNAGEDYLTMSRWSENEDEMRIYFYNSATNRWQWKDLQKNPYGGEYIMPHVYLFSESNEDDILIYSSYRDSVMVLDFNDYVSYYTRGNLVYASTPARSILVNAEECSIHEQNVDFNPLGMGTSSAAFIDETGKTLYGYSALSDQWTIKTIPEEPNVTRDKTCVGLVAASFEGDYWGKFYAFEAMNGTWTEVVPKGGHVGQVVGDRTAMVVRQTHVYAFVPADTTGIGPGNVVQLPECIQAITLYPNPFTDRTTLEYEIVQPARVILKIYDATGHEVRTLQNGRQPAGKWSVTWDGTNSLGHPVAPGVYYYRISDGKVVMNGKMVHSSE